VNSDGQKEGFSAGRNKTYQPEELEILKTFRFEEPAIHLIRIIYLIRANDGMTGYSLDSLWAGEQPRRWL